jgi:integrase
MARTATGQVIENRAKRGRNYALRFRAYGKRRYITLGTSDEGWTRAKADAELANVLADVRRGIWTDPKSVPEPIEPREMPTFHQFSSEWFEARCLEGGRRGTGLSEAGRADLEWRLCCHLIPHFRHFRLDEIGVEQVDAFRRSKVAEGKLGPTSINKVLSTLAAVLEVAVEYGLIDRNPATGKRRRLPSVRPRRSYLDAAEHISALLEAASRLDARGRVRPYRRALLATLIFAGPRLDEALSLRWRDVDLASGFIRIHGTKTESAERTVRMLPVLRDELLAYAAQRTREPSALVFSTSTGAKFGQSNVRRRVLAPAVEEANAWLATRDLGPLPEGLTPHSLRRTYATILYALGETPPVVMAAMGHTDPALALRMYAQAMRRNDGDAERLRVVVDGDGAVAGFGTGTALEFRRAAA